MGQIVSYLVLAAILYLILMYVYEGVKYVKSFKFQHRALYVLDISVEEICPSYWLYEAILENLELQSICSEDIFGPEGYDQLRDRDGNLHFGLRDDTNRASVTTYKLTIGGKLICTNRIPHSSIGIDFTIKSCVVRNTRIATEVNVMVDDKEHELNGTLEMDIPNIDYDKTNDVKHSSILTVIKPLGV